MEKKTKPDEVPPMVVFATVIFLVAYFFGYAYGKDLALKHNAQDARAAAQIETLGR